MIKKIFRKLFPVVNVNSIKLDISNTQIQQRQLFFHYQHLINKKEKLPNFDNTGFRVFSQGDEDGKVLYIFSLIGFKNKICVDMAFESPYGSNSTNLILNWGFTGLLIEANDQTSTKAFFNLHQDTCVYPPTSIRAWITAENVNELCINNGVTGEVDFFSLDMDGVDYHIWKSLNVIQPRVVLVEYQDILGPDVSITVPYKSDFNRHDMHEDFHGASLSAFVQLGKEKGYRLVGTNLLGYNAFFVKNGIGDDVLPEVSVGSCFRHTHPKVKSGMETRYPTIKHFPWVKV